MLHTLCGQEGSRPATRGTTNQHATERILVTQYATYTLWAGGQPACCKGNHQPTRYRTHSSHTVCCTYTLWAGGQPACYKGNHQPTRYKTHSSHTVCYIHFVGGSQPACYKGNHQPTRYRTHSSHTVCYIHFVHTLWVGGLIVTMGSCSIILTWDLENVQIDKCLLNNMGNLHVFILLLK